MNNMIANWKTADVLPEKRIRVITCDKLGYICTGFYGRQSTCGGDPKECWRTDENYGFDEKTRQFTVGREKEIQVSFWDDFPVAPVRFSL